MNKEKRSPKTLTEIKQAKIFRQTNLVKIVNQQLLITLLYYNFKSIFTLFYNFYLSLLLIESCFSPAFVSL